MIKRVFTILAGLFLVLAIASVFMPRQVHVERSTEILAPADDVFDNVNNLKMWDQWSAWHKMDPDAEYVYSPNPIGKDAFYTWNGEAVGEGKLQITKSIRPETIETSLDFKSQGTGAGKWTFQPIDGGDTKVTWGFDTDVGWNPISKCFGLLMDGILGPQFEQGLADLKDLTESQVVHRAIDGESTETESQAETSNSEPATSGDDSPSSHQASPATESPQRSLESAGHSPNNDQSNQAATEDEKE